MKKKERKKEKEKEKQEKTIKSVRTFSTIH